MADLLMKMPFQYEPKKKNRWLLRFPAELGIQEWWLASASRPSITQNEVEIPFLNTSTWVIGRFTWESISVTFRDPIGPSAAQAIMEWVRLQSESITGRQGYAAGYKKDIDLEMNKENLTNRQNKYQEEMNKKSQRLNNKGFVDRAPKDIVEQEKTNYNNLINDIKKISLTLESL